MLNLNRDSMKYPATTEGQGQEQEERI